MIIFLGNGNSNNLYSDVINSTKNTPDIVVSCQYPFLVPKSLIESHTCVNIHYGELPYYAGCNPVFWQVLKDTHAGCTLHYMDENFDSGDIIATDSFPIGKMTADEVYSELERRGKQLFMKYFSKILDGTAPRRKQDLSKRTYYNKSDVDFDRVKHLKDLDDKKLRAVYFKGKQYPTVEIENVKYQLRKEDD